MDWMKVLYSFISVGALGALLGLGLAVASRALAVTKDKKLEQLENALPGLNCGACGYAGCASYAEALLKDETDVTKCSPGGSETAKELGRLLGASVDVSVEKKVAQVHCRGGRSRVQQQYLYSGIRDCNAAFLLYKGDKACKFGCLGFGSCIAVCPVDAIDYDSDGLVWVAKERCISCGKCIDVCPTGVMQWIPYHADYMVACSSTDKGGAVKKYCEVGCIGCRLCEKKAPDGGFLVTNFLARIDYTQQGDREPARKACPTKCIISLTAEKASTEKVSTEQAEAEEKSG